MNWRTILERVSPLWLGIAISGTLMALFLVIETSLGRWDTLRAAGELNPLARVSTGILRDIRLAIVHILWAGYLPAALLYSMRNGRRTVMQLQDALDCTRDECAALARSLALRPRWLVITGIAGALISFATPYIAPPVPSEPWNPAGWSPEVTWHRLVSPPVLVCLSWLAYSVVAVSARLSAVAKKLGRIDLLDLSSLAPFTRVGLTNALLLIGALSIASLMLIETGFGLTIVLIGVPGFVAATLALIAPVRGVHSRIRQSKDAELQQVNMAIARKRDTLRSPEAGDKTGELADLIAYRGLVESVPEWPFTTSTYTRFFLYLLIPAASWVFGVVFEEILSRVLF